MQSYVGEFGRNNCAPALIFTVLLSILQFLLFKNHRRQRADCAPDGFQILVFQTKNWCSSMRWGIKVFRMFNRTSMDGWLESRGRTWLGSIFICGRQPVGTSKAATTKKNWRSTSTWRRFGYELPVKMSSSSNQLGEDSAWWGLASGSISTLNWMINDWILTGVEGAAGDSNRQIMPMKLLSAPRAFVIIFKLRKEVSCSRWMESWKQNKIDYFSLKWKKSKTNKLPPHIYSSISRVSRVSAMSNINCQTASNTRSVPGIMRWRRREKVMKGYGVGHGGRIGRPITLETCLHLMCLR